MSRSASAATTIALLPPSSSSVRPKRPATVWPTRRPIAVDPVNEMSGRRASCSMRSPMTGAGADGQREDAGQAVVGHHRVGDALHRHGAERRRFGRLPDDRVAAHRGEGGVPRPHGDGEVEGRDDPDRAERMPLFHHAVARALGRDGEAVELPREPGGEVADVDHLLHFAVAFGANLPHLERDEVAQRLLDRAQGVAEVAHEVAALRRRHVPPGAEGGGGSGRRRGRRPPRDANCTAAIGAPVVGS